MAKKVKANLEFLLVKAEVKGILGERASSPAILRRGRSSISWKRGGDRPQSTSANLYGG